MLVYQRLEIAQLAHTLENLSKLVTRDAAVVQQDSIDEAEVKNLASGNESTNITLTEEVILQAECLLPDLVHDWQGEIL